MYATVDKQDVERQMQRLLKLANGASSVLSAGVRAHGNVGARAMAEAAPVFDRTRIVNDRYVEPGGLQASFGFRMIRGAAQPEGKAGLGVAKTPVTGGNTVTKASKTAVRYGHLVILGTGMRFAGIKRVWDKKQKRHTFRDSGGELAWRGVVPENRFVEPAYAAAKPQADQKAYEAMEQRLRKLEAAQA